MRSVECYLALDIGTSGCRVVAFSPDGVPIASKAASYRVKIEAPDRATLDPNEVLARVRECVRGLTEAPEPAAGTFRAERPPSEQRLRPVAIAVSALGEAVTLVHDSGSPLSPTLLPMDYRGRDVYHAFVRRFGGEKLYRATGHPVHPMFTLAKLLWYRDNEPELLERARWILDWQAYVTYLLTGVPATDRSLAARTQLFDIHQHTWSREIINSAGIPSQKLPRVGLSGTEVGRVGEASLDALGLERGVRVVLGGFDQACAALGAGLVSHGEALDSTGTTLCVAGLVSGPMVHRELMRAGFHTTPYLLPGSYLLVGGSLTGGNLLDWFHRTWSSNPADEEADYNALFSGIDLEPGEVIALPHFAGAGTPYLNPAAKGALLGLTLETSRSDLVKAFIDGIDYLAMENLRMLRRLGIDVVRVRAAGGAARSGLWLQRKADTYGVPVVASAGAHAAALGCALLGATATGRFGKIEEGVVAWLREGKTFLPDEDRHRRHLAAQERFVRLWRLIADI